MPLSNNRAERKFNLVALDSIHITISKPHESPPNCSVNHAGAWKGRPKVRPQLEPVRAAVSIPHEPLLNESVMRAGAWQGRPKAHSQLEPVRAAVFHPGDPEEGRIHGAHAHSGSGAASHYVRAGRDRHRQDWLRQDPGLCAACPAAHQGPGCPRARRWARCSHHGPHPRACSAGVNVIFLPQMAFKTIPKADAATGLHASKTASECIRHAHLQAKVCLRTKTAEVHPQT